MSKSPERTVLWDLPHYMVVLGNVYMEDRERAVEGYNVINKQTKVIEAERNTLPEAVFVAKRLNSMLDEMNEPDAGEHGPETGELPLELPDQPLKPH